MTSNMIYIVAPGGGFTCPHKILVNTQCPLPQNSDVLYESPLSHSFFANECKFRLEDRVIFLPKIQISVTFDVHLMIVFLAKITHFSNRLIFVRVFKTIASPKVPLTKPCGEVSFVKT
jgi:hypothetical protein